MTDLGPEPDEADELARHYEAESEDLDDTWRPVETLPNL